MTATAFKARRKFQNQKKKKMLVFPERDEFGLIKTTEHNIMKPDLTEEERQVMRAKIVTQLINRTHPSIRHMCPVKQSYLLSTLCQNGSNCKYGILCHYAHTEEELVTAKTKPRDSRRTKKKKSPPRRIRCRRRARAKPCMTGFVHAGAFASPASGRKIDTHKET